ncbi:MAG: NmrA family NAD(P)-binding protein [Ectothiorhodospiraceae bacterium]|nr:NmrA family NAD(P)-binding protein [Ectothiorhodospiraceae bacterium]
MTKPTILISGATGKTGFYAAKSLLDKGYNVKAMARKTSDKTDELKALGAEIMLADFLDLASLEKAMKAATRAYFVYPPADGLLESTANFIVAAKTNGLESVVNMSQISVRKYHPSPLTSQHWLAEEMLNLSGMNVTHVCPSFFADMLYLMNGGNILQQGKMYLPHGDAYHAPIAAEDIGMCVAAILENPKKYNGQRLVLTGPVRLSQKDIAAVASKILCMPIEYISITTDQWADAMNQSGLMSKFLIKHLIEVGKDYQEGVFDKVTTTVESLTGQKAMSMKTFIESNKLFFTPQFLQAMSQKLSAETAKTKVA